MNREADDAAAAIGELKFFPEPDTARLLGVIAALGSEVFVLKAQVERLTRALLATGTLAQAALDQAGNSPELAKWMSAEEKAFSETIMRPYGYPDEAINVAAMMRES
ncbi:MAG: hypothetical protein EXR27_08625 [Betaproteobacteria bacterium]|nr:hypothetical protein [Betaproteobacteria bacterium]